MPRNTGSGDVVPGWYQNIVRNHTPTTTPESIINYVARIQREAGLVRSPTPTQMDSPTYVENEDDEDFDEDDNEEEGVEAVPIDTVLSEWVVVDSCNCPECKGRRERNEPVVIPPWPEYPENVWYRDLTQGLNDQSLLAYDAAIMRQTRAESEVRGPNHWCCGCGKNFDNSTTRGVALCGSCEAGFFVCRYCGKARGMDRAVQLDHDNGLGSLNEDNALNVCVSCSTDYYWLCPQHNRYERRDRGPCQMHHNREMNRDRRNRRDDRSLVEITNYSYKPDALFHEVGRGGEKITGYSPTPKTVYMGFELECEMGEQPRQHGLWQLKNAFGDLVYYKTDGSLSGGGVEMVSRPMTLDYAHEMDWGVLEELAKQGWRSWDTGSAGIHVHVGRTAFEGDLHLWRFAQLITRNKSQVQKVAGRNSSYASFDDNGEITGVVLKKMMHPHSLNRYRAVNLQNHSTVEIRIFRGSLKKERLLADLEFVDACVEYSRMPDVDVPVVVEEVVPEPVAVPTQQVEWARVYEAGEIPSDYVQQDWIREISNGRELYSVTELRNNVRNQSSIYRGFIRGGDGDGGYNIFVTSMQATDYNRRNNGEGRGRGVDRYGNHQPTPILNPQPEIDTGLGWKDFYKWLQLEEHVTRYPNFIHYITRTEE